MIKITNEISGKKYELVPRTQHCKGCAFHQGGECKLKDRYFYFNYLSICTTLSGIWKEMRDEN